MSTLYIDRLRGGEEFFFEEEMNPDFLNLENDPEFSSSEKVRVSGKAYLAGDWLVIQGSIETALTVLCSMCNESFGMPVHVDWVHEEPISNIKGGLFDYSELVREEILLEVPYYRLCGG